MNKNFKDLIWSGLGVSLILFCTPIGIYSGIQGLKLQRRLKIGDTNEVEKCKSRIKISWGITILFYIIIIILATTGVLD